MKSFNVMGLFCEDIREEKNDVVTLVGILPDNVNFAQIGPDPTGNPHTVLSKLCVYVRINFDPDFDIGEPQIRLVYPDGSEASLGSIEAKVIQESRAEALTRGSPLSGVLVRAVMVPFNAPVGVIRLEVTVAGEPHLAAVLNCRSAEPIASPPPS